MFSVEKIPAVILAGGSAKRLGGVEKGLQLVNNQPLISLIIAQLSSQVSTIFLNINRHIETYQQYYPHLPYFCDEQSECWGPLAGMSAGLNQIDSPYLLFVPCDCPYIPDGLFMRLYRALVINQAKVSYVHTGEKAYPTFALIHRSLRVALQTYLANGQRKVMHFFQSQPSVAVDFSDCQHLFYNLNTVADFSHFNCLPYLGKRKILAIVASSGTGKTTLLERLIPELLKLGIKVGAIKHSHHHIDIDKPGKDSYRLRMAGANPVAIVSDKRWAVMQETAFPLSFSNLLHHFNNESLDLVLVEGFKDEALPKIILHRQATGECLPESDRLTVAIATDSPVMIEGRVKLDINNLVQIVQFIHHYVRTAETACFSVE